jgi:hypothetical protein
MLRTYLKKIALYQFGIPKCTKIKGTCSYVRLDDGPRGPKHVACGYPVKVCRCVGRMYIFYHTNLSARIKGICPSWSDNVEDNIYLIFIIQTNKCAI